MEPENNPGFLSKAKLESVSVPVEGFQKTAGQRQSDVGYTLLYVLCSQHVCKLLQLSLHMPHYRDHVATDWRRKVHIATRGI